MTESLSESERRPRKPLQVSVRTMLLGVTLLAVAVAVAGRPLYHAAHEARLHRRLVQLGARVNLADRSFWRGGNSINAITLIRPPSGALVQKQYTSALPASSAVKQDGTAMRTYSPTTEVMLTKCNIAGIDVQNRNEASRDVAKNHESRAK